MRTIRALLYVTIPLALLGFLQAFALADTPVDPTANPAGAVDQFWQAVTGRKWGLAAVVGTMLFVAFVRFITPRIHGKFGTWINSTRVSAALALISGGGAAVATQLMKGGALTPKLLVYGFTIGVGAIGGYNVFWDILFPADKKPPSSTSDSAADLAKKTPPSPPPPVRAGVLLPLIFVAFAFVGCGHVTPSQKAFGDAYAACMTAKGLAAAPSVAQEAWGDLNNGTNQATIVGQLEALAGRAGTDAVTCAVQAWLGGASLMPSTTPGKLAEKNPAGVAAANAYLKAHAPSTTTITIERG